MVIDSLTFSARVNEKVCDREISRTSLKRESLNKERVSRDRQTDRRRESERERERERTAGEALSDALQLGESFHPAWFAGAVVLFLLALLAIGFVAVERKRRNVAERVRECERIAASGSGLV